MICKQSYLEVVFISTVIGTLSKLITIAPLRRTLLLTLPNEPPSRCPL